jgi:hypothetical protein
LTRHAISPQAAGTSAVPFGQEDPERTLATADEMTLMMVVSDIRVVTVESIPRGAEHLRIFESLTVPPELRSIQ